MRIEDCYEPWDRWFSNAIYPSANVISIIFQDITDRKLSEMALRESEKHYTFLAQSANELAKIESINEESRRLNSLVTCLTTISPSHSHWKSSSKCSRSM